MVYSGFFYFSQGVVKIFYDARNGKFAEFSKGVVDGRPFEGGVIMDFETVCINRIEEILILYRPIPSNPGKYMYTNKLLNNRVNLTIYSNKKSLVKRITTFSGVDSLLNARNYNIRIKS